jgi:hypothetical protein
MFIDWKKIWKSLGISLNLKTGRKEQMGQAQLGSGKPYGSLLGGGSPASLKSPEELAKENRARNSELFRTAAWAGVKWLAENMEVFTADDLWDYLEDFNFDYTPEPRLLGSVIRRGKKEGIIAEGDKIFRSRRKVCHGRPIRCWVSLVYKGEDK